MIFAELVGELQVILSSMSFEDASDYFSKRVFGLKKDELLELVVNIGILPEAIRVDSSEEKLFAKLSDIVLARCLNECALESQIYSQRANSADVWAKSHFHSYSLVADAKVFRLSRTAKNQKDFKVQSMKLWPGEHNYAVLICPLFQYPRVKSQIYAQALENNILLLSWEHLALMIGKGIRETASCSLQSIWNMSHEIKRIGYSGHKTLWEVENKLFCNLLDLEPEEFHSQMNAYRRQFVSRGNEELKALHRQLHQIQDYSREKAISELIAAMRYNEKISMISRYIQNLENWK